MPNETILSFDKNLSSEEKIEILFRKYYAVLCQGVFRILKDETLSEDVVQEVFIKVWEKKDKLDYNEAFIYYLKKSCYHTALNLIAGEKHYSNETMKVVVDGKSADGDIHFSELENAVQGAIRDLPEKTRLVFSLSRYEQMTYKEIAIQLGISVKAVEKHMSIALQRLRIALKDHLVHVLLILFKIL